MDDVTAADIRKWAWDQVSNYRVKDGETHLQPYTDRLLRADDVAAWVMSGKLPDVTDEIVK